MTRERERIFSIGSKENIVISVCMLASCVGGLWPVSLLSHKCWAINFHFTIPNGMLGIDLKGLLKVNI